MRARSAAVGAVLGAVVVTTAACQNVPEPAGGRAIRGRVSYRGDAHLRFERPVLQVAALALVPPPGRPHGVVFIEGPDFSAPIPYELLNLAPWRYKIVGRVSDVAHRMIDETKLPTGGYPDFCSFVTGPNNVEVTADFPATGIDFTLYDGGGAEDPCNRPEDACPRPGAASLEVVLELERAAEDIKAPDQLVFAALESPTQIPPARFRILPASAIAMKGFPYTILVNDLPPGAYLVYACYDVGGDSLMGCGPEDFSHTYMDSAYLPVAAGKITKIRMALDKRTSALVTIDEPATRGCP
jgi:hypothetical protein